jgi:disulfide bond formation protein DsbB
MQTLLPIINKLIASGIVLIQIATIFLLLNLFIKNSNKKIINFTKNNSLIIIFIISLGAMLTSLFYSNVIGYEPCTLCWVQRIFMYPIVFISGLAIYKKEFSVIPYIKMLAVLGLLIATYHIYIDLGGSPLLDCSAEVVSCTKRYVHEFGYITIPVMSFTLFAFILTVFYSSKNK